MIKPMKYLFLFAVSALLLSCGGAKEETPADAQTRIRAMEDSVFQTLSFDERKARALIDVYKAYATANPYDSVSAEYLFRAANVAKSMHDGEQSVEACTTASITRLPELAALAGCALSEGLHHR
jgi:hypothetical protein